VSSCRQLEHDVEGGKDERAKRGVSLIQNLEPGVTTAVSTSSKLIGTENWIKLHSSLGSIPLKNM